MSHSQEMIASHTPGPWVPGNETDSPSMRLMVYANDALGSRIADCSCSGHGITDEQDRANVRLIAAAPDLFVALQTAQKRLERVDDNSAEAVSVRIVIGAALAQAVRS